MTLYFMKKTSDYKVCFQKRYMSPPPSKKGGSEPPYISAEKQRFFRVKSFSPLYFLR